jgi:cytochrome c oxidase accessory protein FixG
MICPYGRLQGVMLDANSMVVAYDHKRGEPRGKINKKEEQSDLGDCVDCGLCVDVCPTGIDIRNGTQLECVNCTACMDACDSVMEKIKRPEGLIRIDSSNNIEKGIGFKVTSRIKVYSAIMIVLIALSSFILLTRKDIEASILRMPGKTYIENTNGNVTNLYSLELVNKTFEDLSFVLTIDNPNVTLNFSDSDSILPANSEMKKQFTISIHQDNIKKNISEMNLRLYGNGKLIREFNTSYLGPVQ